MSEIGTMPGKRNESGTRSSAAPGWRRVVLGAAGLVLLALFLAYADASFTSYRLQLVSLVAINAVVAIALTVTSGYTGVFSLGQIGFFGIGAYVGALLTIAPKWKAPRVLPGLPEWLAGFDTTSWPPQLALLLACLAAGVVAAAVAVVVGLPLMRLSGHYVAVATLGFLIIVNAVLINWASVTRGARGLNQIPSHTTTWVAFAWVIVAIYAALRLRSSPYGRAMLAQRENLLAARGIGISILPTRLLAFVFGAFFTGAAGALLAHQIGAVAPTLFSFTTTFTVVIMVVLGGLGSVSGAVVGAAIMTLAPEFLREVEGGFTIGAIQVGAHHGLAQIILAVGFILVMIFRPTGLFGDRELGVAFLSRRPPNFDAQGADESLTPIVDAGVDAVPEDTRN
ncbi:MAG: branched-chain amino acid ABC transporter permease [Thermomicrobiales bacterium]|nr:branched-chain amino acid ABC transporter permease [Thermomicrobiales bacterium]